MFIHQGMYLPDGEKHFPLWMSKNGEIVNGRGTYQVKKWRACIPYIRQWRTAVDVGGHVGFWSLQMAPRFSGVIAFEPVPGFRECFGKNVLAGNVTLHPCALGSVSGKVRMKIDPADSGGTHVDPVSEGGNVEMRTLDSFGLENIDFVKIDCEGFERQVVEGAKETLKRCRPCVICEQKQHKLLHNFGINGTPAVDYLKGLGAVLRKEIGGDYILSWP